LEPRLIEWTGAVASADPVLPSRPAVLRDEGVQISDGKTRAPANLDDRKQLFMNAAPDGADTHTQVPGRLANVQKTKRNLLHFLVSSARHPLVGDALKMTVDALRGTGS
jgi:hypothetical protein